MTVPLEVSRREGSGIEKGLGWEYTVSKGRRLRRGYTTGTCAAAAAKGAAAMLFSAGAEDMKEVSILTPAGIELCLPLAEVERRPGEVQCAVRKDSGDDPDLTNGILVCALVREKEETGIVLRGGRGVGIVTRPGLPVDLGEAAINPAPRAMILESLAEVLPPGRGVEVVISIPAGEALAQKTFNPRLGIVGGLSILGTTGIVEPMSEEAFKEIITLELKLLSPEKRRFLVLVPGNHGKRMAQELGLPREKIIKMSNFVGFMLDRCKQYGVQEVLLLGHIGKIFKVAGGIFHTHSRVADARFELFAAHAALLGAGTEIIAGLQQCVTAEAMLEVLDTLPVAGIYDLFADRVSARAASYGGGALRVGTVLCSQRRGVLGMDARAKLLLEAYACPPSTFSE